VLERARQFESQQRWGEALTVYEEALREHRGDATLTGRHDLAKIHYDLARRYADASFVRGLSALSERDALALYNEVLLKIQSHYVNEPDWRALVRRGAAAARVALGEEPFARQHLQQVPTDQVSAFGAELAGLPGDRTLATRQHAAELVAQAARQGQQQLGLSPAVTTLEFAAGALGALDEYSSYLTHDQLTEVYSQIEGNFVGLGVELKAGEGGLQIVKVIAGSPAQRSGIRGGDRIIAVDGQSTGELSTDQAADLLQGEEGSQVELTFVRGEQPPRRVVVRRQHVDVPSIDEARLADRESGIAYLKLTCFQKTTSRDLDQALWQLHGQGMRSLVIDLRGNPGGLLTAAVEAVDKFVEAGTIVSTRGRSAVEDFTYSAQRAGTWRVPLVVLIDGDSASASEIFAGAIRDHRRGTVVGARSYGKGSVQGIFPLTVAGAGVRLTTAKFYSPSGRPISNVGVQPDLQVQVTARPVTGGEPAGDAADAALDAALKVARQQLARR
jgi:carboxyl-terminal processing protease